MKKIAILYADYGSGHKSVTNNLQKILKDYDVITFNARKRDNKYTTAVTEFVYNDFVSKNANNPIIKNGYHISYKLVGGSKVLSHIFIKRLGYRFIEEMIEEEKPDLVILTFPYYIGKKDIKSLTIITDYTVDNTWYDKATDYYFVASPEIKDKLIKKGVLKENIFITGIPLSSEFDQDNESQELKNILFNLGARGQVKILDVKKWIDYSLNKNLKVSVLCGKNEEIYEGLKIIYEDEIKIYPFTDKVPEILKENDVVITKAGGLSVTESIMSETPIIINLDQSLKGQEKTNYDYIVENDLGITTKEKDMEAAIDYFAGNSKRYQEVVQNLKKIKVKNQNQKIKKIIDGIIDEKH